MLLKIYPQNLNSRHIQKVVDILKEGGIVIYPTDTVYALGCDMKNPRAIERLARLKGVKPAKANFSFIFHDLSHLSDYTKQVSNPVFKLLKKNLPGPFTFILPATNEVHKLFKNNKKTIGIRIPDNPITLELVKALGNPIITTSIHDDDQILEYTTDPDAIYENYRDVVDVVIDGGFGNNIASTVVDCTSSDIEIIRQGSGVLKQ